MKGVAYMSKATPGELASLIAEADARRTRGEWSQAKWAFGPYCWALENVRRFREPIPWVGQRGWFFVPNDAVRDAIASAEPCR